MEIQAGNFCSVMHLTQFSNTKTPPRALLIRSTSLVQPGAHFKGQQTIVHQNQFVFKEPAGETFSCQRLKMGGAGEMSSAAMGIIIMRFPAPLEIQHRRLSSVITSSHECPFLI